MNEAFPSDYERYCTACHYAARGKTRDVRDAIMAEWMVPPPKHRECKHMRWMADHRGVRCQDCGKDMRA